MFGASLALLARQHLNAKAVGIFHMKTGIALFPRRGAPLLQILNDRVFVEALDSNRKVVDRPGGAPAPDSQMAALPQPQTDSRGCLVLVQHRQIKYALVKRPPAADHPSPASVT